MQICCYTIYGIEFTLSLPSSITTWPTFSCLEYLLHVDLEGERKVTIGSEIPESTEMLSCPVLPCSLVQNMYLYLEYNIIA